MGKVSHIGKETKFITKLFKDSSVNITFTTQNTISKLLSTKSHPSQEQFENSGVYQLTCPDCNVRYIGQTGRFFCVRFSKHFRDYKYANNKSKFARHLLEISHSIAPIENIMEVLYSTNKGKLMDTMERFHIYKETCINNQTNDKNSAKPNIIFETIVRKNTNRVHTTR
jgi:hypothetical protein